MNDNELALFLGEIEPLNAEDYVVFSGIRQRVFVAIAERNIKAIESHLVALTGMLDVAHVKELRRIAKVLGCSINIRAGRVRKPKYSVKKEVAQRLERAMQSA